MHPVRRAGSRQPTLVTRAGTPSAEYDPVAVRCHEQGLCPSVRQTCFTSLDRSQERAPLRVAQVQLAGRPSGRVTQPDPVGIYTALQAIPAVAVAALAPARLLFTVGQRGSRASAYRLDSRHVACNRQQLGLMPQVFPRGSSLKHHRTYGYCQMAAGVKR